jgi:hypothetical protein
MASNNNNVSAVPISLLQMTSNKKPVNNNLYWICHANSLEYLEILSNIEKQDIKANIMKDINMKIYLPHEAQLKVKEGYTYTVKPRKTVQDLILEECANPKSNIFTYVACSFDIKEQLWPNVKKAEENYNIYGYIPSGDYKNVDWQYKCFSTSLIFNNNINERGEQLTLVSIEDLQKKLEQFKMQIAETVSEKLIQKASNNIGEEAKLEVKKAVSTSKYFPENLTGSTLKLKVGNDTKYYTILRHVDNVLKFVIQTVHRNKLKRIEEFLQIPYGTVDGIEWDLIKLLKERIKSQEPMNYYAFGCTTINPIIAALGFT